MVGHTRQAVAGHAAEQEKLAAAKDGEAELGVDGVDGNVQLPSDPFVGEPVKTAEDENLAAAGRERGDGLVEDFDFLIVGDIFRGIESIFYHGQLLDIPYAVGRRHPVMTGNVERGISGSDEKIGTDLLQLASNLGAEEPSVGFLNQIIHVGQSGKPATEVGAEGGFVGLHFGREPLGMIRRGKLAER